MLCMDEETTGHQPPDEGELTGSSRPMATRRLTRRTDRRVLGGVASGLAEYFTIDPVICRLAFVALGLVTFPFGVLVYLIAWAVVPADTGGERRREDSARVLWVILAVLAAVLVAIPVLALTFAWLIGLSGPFPWYGPFGFDIGFGPGLFWALTLIGLGVLLFRRSEPARSSSAAPSLPQPANEPTGSTPVARPPRQPSILGRLAVAAGLIVAGVAALLDNLGVVDLSARRLLALLMLVVGVTLLVGTWWGNARWLIVIGVLLIPALFSVSVVDAYGASLRGPFGDRAWRPASRAEVARPFMLGVGDLLLDLTGLPLSADATRVAAGVGMGDVSVVVPADAEVTVNSRVGVGELDVFGRRWAGMALNVTDHSSGQGRDGRLVLDLKGGLGDVTVRRAPATTSAEGQ